MLGPEHGNIKISSRADIKHKSTRETRFIMYCDIKIASGYD